MPPSIVVENLRFGYARTEILHGLSFAIAPGEVIGLITGVTVVVVRHGLRVLHAKIQSDLARMGGVPAGMVDTADG
jgi:hypothetical protein